MPMYNCLFMGIEPPLLISQDTAGAAGGQGTAIPAAVPEKLEDGVPGVNVPAE
jgi:hypothetical protein